MVSFSVKGLTLCPYLIFPNFRIAVYILCGEHDLLKVSVHIYKIIKRYNNLKSN